MRASLDQRFAAQLDLVSDFGCLGIPYDYFLPSHDTSRLATINVSNSVYVNLLCKRTDVYAPGILLSLLKLTQKSHSDTVRIEGVSRGTNSLASDFQRIFIARRSMVVFQH